MEVIGSPRIPLVGRSAEIAVLRGVIEDAAHGRARAALIEGEAGIGKTRVLDEALDFARQRGFDVLFGACDELERDRPLRAIAEALHIERGAIDPRRAALAGLLSARPATPLTPGMAVADEGWLIVEALLDVLEEAAATAPVAFAVDDLQWADPLTLRALHSILRHLTRVPFVLLAAARRGVRHTDVDRTLADLVTRGAEHVLLRPLAAPESAALASHVVGLPIGPHLVEDVAGAGGNPLFVIELVRALGDDGVLERNDGLVDTRNVSLPPTLRLTILRRLSLFPVETLHLLRVASILGATFSVAELALMTGKKPTTLVPELADVVDAGLLAEAGDRLAFRHDLVREAIYHDLPLAVRKGLHREAASALDGVAAPVERVASHVALGAEAGDTAAVEWLQRAAQTTAGRAPATAVRLLERALAIADVDDERDVLEAQLLLPLVAVGRIGDAEALGRGVLARRPPPAIDIMVRHGLAAVLSSTARYPEAIDHIDRAAAVASEQEHSSLAAVGSLLMVLAGELAQAREAAQRAIEDGERLGNEHAVCQGLQALAMATLVDGNVDEAISLAKRAVTAVEGVDAVWINQVVPHLWHGTALSDADRFDEAEAVLYAGRRRAEQSGNLSRLALYHWAIAETRLGAGQWDDAVAEAESGLGLIEEANNQVGDVFAHALCAHVAFHRGDHARARSAVDEARRRVVAGPLEIGYEWMSWVEALLLEAEGEPSQALHLLAAAWDDGAPVRYLQAAGRAMGPDLVRMAVAFGDRERACSVTEELERAAGLNPAPTARGLALRCRGLLENDSDILLHAVAVHREGPRPHPLAAACEAAGLALGRAGSANDARALLGEAAAIYERLAADGDAARVRTSLATLGVTRARTRHRPTYGWDSLTPTERRVISHAVEGLTNREIAERLFVSRRTVATHMEHIFQKLGCANRVELAADAARRDVTR